MRLFLNLLSAIAVAALVPLDLVNRDLRTQTTIPSQLSTSNTIANFISSKYGFDGPQLSVVNNLSFEWWYFDAVSQNAQIAISVIFFTSVDSGFPLLSDSSDATSVLISYRLANGTVGFIPLFASEATIKTEGQGSSGEFVGTGVTWKGSSDLSSYRIEFDSPAIKGSFKLNSNVPAQFPCSPVLPGQSLLVAPNIGWNNAIPDADAYVDLTILGSKLKFDGSAYHDKNWGDQPWNANMASEYWGHIRIGPYKVVWLNILDRNGTEHISAYAARHNRILTTSCSPTSLLVRPINSTYPPSIATSDPTAFSIVLDLGRKGTLRVNITAVADLINVPVYRRWSGTAVGAVDGGKMLQGYGVWEQFKWV